MLSDPLTFVLLGLAAYRLTRLAGWDDFPLAAKIRAWVIGERWVALEPIGRITSVEETQDGLVVTGTLDANYRFGTALDDLGAEPLLPGKQPFSEAEGVRPAYDRPMLAHLVHCPFCVGWWISLAVYLAWVAEPRWALYAAAPLAISGFVGLVAKNLDP